MKHLRIALVEVGGSHDECLLTQLHALHRHGCAVILITTEDVAARNPHFTHYVETTHCVDRNVSRKVLARTVWNHLKASKLDKVVLNTAQGKVIRDLCIKALFHPIEFVGIIHTTRMFTESFTQKIIHRKIRKYLLLSAYLKEKVAPQKGLQLDYFYPLRFPHADLPAEGGNKQVVIIGGVEQRRKDLSGFLEMIQGIEDWNIRFVFLGKSDFEKPEVKSFLDAIRAKGLQERIQTYDHFVSQEEFDKVVRSSVLILPLVHPNTPSADQYFRNQISGAMTVSFGYKIPMLIHEAYSHISEMEPASFYYNEETFPDVLEQALIGAEHKREIMQNREPYSIQFQEDRYISFLGLDNIQS